MRIGSFGSIFLNTNQVQVCGSPGILNGNRVVASEIETEAGDAAIKGSFFGSRQESYELIASNIRSVPLRYDLNVIKEPDRTQAICFD